MDDIGPEFVRQWKRKRRLHWEDWYRYSLMNLLAST
jgi:hypothetical protein